MAPYTADLELLRTAAELLFGPQWQAPLARALGVSRRQTVAWAAGEHQPREKVWMQLAELVWKRQAELKAVQARLRKR